MKNLLTVFIAFFIVACASEEENQFIKKISTFYNANVSLSKGISADGKDGSSKYLKLDIHMNEPIKSSNIEPELIATNSAMILFNSIPEEERNSYDQFIIEMTIAGSDNFSFKIDKDRLANACLKYIALSRWLGLIKNKNYEEAHKQLTDYAQTIIPRSQFDSTWTNLEKKHGKITSSDIVGFYTETVATDSMNIFLYNYRIVFKGERNNYSMDVFMSDKNLKRNIFGLIVRKEETPK